MYWFYLFLLVVDYSVALCGHDCSPNERRLQVDMQPGKGTDLCLNHQNYRVKDLTVLNADCNQNTSSNSSRYNCTVVNVTEQASISDNDSSKPMDCEQLVTIECVRNRIGRRRCYDECECDDDDRGGECGSRDGSDSGGGGGDLSNQSEVEDSDDEDLVLCLTLERTDGNSGSNCTVYVDISMQVPGSNDYDDLCDDLTPKNLDFCLAVCTNDTLNNVDICSDIAESILEETSLEDKDVDTIINILQSLSLLRGSVSSLNATVDIVFNLVDLLVFNPSLVDISRGQMLTAIIDETLSVMRLEEWQDLQQGPDQYQSSRLLNSLETIHLTLSDVVASQNNFVYRGDNVKLLAVERVGEEDVLSGVYHFPANASINASARLEIPRRILCSSSLKQNNTGCSSIVSAAIVQNLPSYLDQTASISSSYRSGSLLMSVNIENTFESTGDVDYLLEEYPVNIYFNTHEQTTSIQDVRCVFWNFTTRNWSSEGLTTVRFNNSNMIKCSSSHLTSFAVLVDVSSKGQNDKEAFGLKLVSYVGCVISLVCLALSLLILISCGKELKKGVLLYIHINFVIALILALLVFVTGIETAVKVQGLCAAIAVLLHYLFLSVFCWMLAEGIMLYLLVVRVFGTLASKWYYLLILGWGLPIPIVVASVGVRYNDYGTGDVCWLPITSGTVWSFIGPMIAIILVNIIILILTLRSLLQGKKIRQSTTTHKSTKLVMIWSTMKSTFILLPLLGVTWIIGVLAINENTTVFAWLFTILNSLQGFFIFILHVLRNDKVWSTVQQAVRRPFYCCRCQVMHGQESIMTRSKSNSVTIATTNTNFQDCEQASESADHPVIGRSYSETSQDSTIELTQYILTQKRT